MSLFILSLTYCYIFDESVEIGMILLSDLRVCDAGK